MNLLARLHLPCQRSAAYHAPTPSQTLVPTGVQGAFGGGQWMIEGHGVEPDVQVDNLPWSTYLGSDAQLEAAVSYLLGEIETKPLPPIQAPPRPTRGVP